MNSSDTLKCAQQANQLVEEVSKSIEAITREKNHIDYAASTANRALEEKLVKIRVYVSELVYELKWRDEVSKTFKQEMDRVVYMLMGMAICGVWLHFIR